MLLRYLYTVPFLTAILAQAAEKVEIPDGPAKAPKTPAQTIPLGVNFNSTFADQDVLKPVIVNRHMNTLNILITNNEPEPLHMEVVGGSLFDINKDRIIKNLTTRKIDAPLNAGQTTRVPFPFNVDVHPQDCYMEVAVVFSNAQGRKVTGRAYNGTVSVIDPPTSILDPQIIFLYLFILAGLGGVGFWAYNTWVVPMMPKKKKAPRQVTKQPVPEVAVSTSADVNKKSYDESWIPEHITRTTSSQKVRGSTPSRTKSSMKVSD